MKNKQNSIRVNFRNDALLLSTSELYDLDANGLKDDNEQQVDSLVPYRNMTIYNDGATDMVVRLNNRRGYDIVPKGSIFKVTDDRINNVKVTNLSAIATGKYYLTLDSQETDLSILKGILAKVMENGK